MGGEILPGFTGLFQHNHRINSFNSYSLTGKRFLDATTTTISMPVRRSVMSKMKKKERKKKNKTKYAVLESVSL